MPGLVGHGVGLEIGHALFMDIVGYSKRLVNEQTALIQRLNGILRRTREFREAEAAGKLITVPTGDVMALVFFTTPDMPVRCAIGINEADRDHPKIELRMASTADRSIAWPTSTSGSTWRAREST